MSALDPHERPPELVRNVYKKYQRMKSADLDNDTAILHLEPLLARGVDPHGKLRIVDEWDSHHLTAACHRFGGDQAPSPQTSPLPVYEHDDMPGR